MVYRLRVVPEFQQLERMFFERVSQEINEALEDGRQEIVDESPVGVSPFGQSLRGNWIVAPIQLLRNDRGVIRNTLSDSFERMVGSPSGTLVDPRPGSPLFRWAQSKGLSSYRVAKSIRARGTLRWRTGDNPLDLSETGRLRTPDVGIPGRITTDIRRRIMRLRF